MTSPGELGAAEAGCSAGPATSQHDAGEDGEFEVMYLVTEPAGAPGRDGSASAGPPTGGPGAAPRDLAVELRAALDEIGGSVAVVGADGLWQAHVHTDDPFAAMAIPGRLGVDQEQVGVRHLPSQSGVHGARRRGLGLVAVTSARALVPDLARAGAVVMASDGPPTAAALDRALDDTGARRVLVLSGPQLGEVTHHGGAGPVRIEVVDGLWGVQVVVGAATFAAAATTTDDVDGLLGEVAAAVDGVRCAALDAGDDLAGTLDPLLHQDATLVTVLTSQETPGDDVEALRAHVAGVRPDVEVVVLPSGAPGRRLVLGVE